MFSERLEKVLVVVPRLYTLQPFLAGTPTVTYVERLEIEIQKLQGNLT